MSKLVTKKNQVRNQSAGESAASAPGGHGARSGDATKGAPLPQAPSFGSVAGGVGGVGGASLAGGSPGAGGFHAAGGGHAAAAGGVYGVGAQATAPWWPAAGLGTSFAVQGSPSSSEWMYPHGSFMNMLQNPFANYAKVSQQPENFHFVGGPMSQSRVSTKGTPSPTGSSVDGGSDGAAQNGSQDKEVIDVDDNVTAQTARSLASSDGKSDRRLSWSFDEDIRLVSAWLLNSIDPIDGNDKKSDKYWSDVTSTYNSTTKCDRMRNRNQLKLRWERIKKPVTEFCGCYTRITKVHQSGMSDDQKMDKALQLYASEHNDKPFTMIHVWRVLRHEKKWSAYVKKMNNGKDKSASPNSVLVVNVEDEPKQRPVGHKKAKEEQRKGKRPAPEAISAIDQKLDKFIEVSNKAEKMAEVQQSLADKKLEAAQLNHKTTQEQTKCKMMDLYKELWCTPTSGMSEEALAERSKAMESMRLALFSMNN